MAYPTVSAPYGFHPINRVDGTPYAGQTRLIPIASTYNTAIFYGDLVKIVAAGTRLVCTAKDFDQMHVHFVEQPNRIRNDHQLHYSQRY